MHKLTLSGTSKDRGHQHGEGLRKQIQELAQIRKNLIRQYLGKMSEQDLNDIINDQLLFFKQPKYNFLREEFDAIAEAAQISRQDLAILNNYTDLRDFGVGHTEGCSALSWRAQKEVFCGQTWDMHASARPYVTHLSVKGENPQEILTIAGCLALTGVNSHSVSVLINNMHCRETSTGLFWTVLVRGMLDQPTAQAATDYLKGNLPCSGHNYLICDPKESYNVESSGTRTEITSHLIKSGAVFHTNHYVGMLKEVEILSRQSKTTFARYEALENYFDSLDHNKAAQNGLMKTVIQDIFEERAVKNVCIAPPKNDPHGSMTCGGIGLDLVHRKGISFAGMYDEKDHHHFQW